MQGNSTQLQLETQWQDKCHRCVFPCQTITIQSSEGGKSLQLDSRAELCVCVGDFLYRSHPRKLINPANSFISNGVWGGTVTRFVTEPSERATFQARRRFRGEVTAGGRGFGSEKIRNKSLWDHWGNMSQRSHSHTHRPH